MLIDVLLAIVFSEEFRIIVICMASILVFFITHDFITFKLRKRRNKDNA